jgi:hypothetical protein
LARVDEQQGSVRRSGKSEEHEQHNEDAEQPNVGKLRQGRGCKWDVASGQSEGLSVVLH